MPNKPSTGVELSTLGQSMSVFSLEPIGLDLLHDEYIKVFNKVMEAKNLRANPTHEGVLDAEQANETKLL